MSVTIQTIITCDGSTILCEGSDWSADASYTTAKEQRKRAKEMGWRKVGKRDYCPNCWSALKGGKP